ncbi:hypothetical protein LBMAG53_20190 [Planctomycetota bacterium]|nr:hypothetical protein LBMAG53_20190 [Planctomycetota bacterium]
MTDLPSSAPTILTVLDPRLPESVAVVSGIRQHAPGWKLVVNLWDLAFTSSHSDAPTLLAALTGLPRIHATIGHLHSNRLMDWAKALGGPVVNLATAWMEPGVHYVIVDGFLAGKQAGAHLRMRGVRRFACVTRAYGMFPQVTRKDEERFGSQKRVVGFREEIGDIALFIAGDFSPDRVAPILTWIRAGGGPAGIFVTSDAVARQLLTVLEDAGVRVPLDVLVVSSDDEVGMCQACRPTLSSVRMPYQAIGRRAAEVVTELLAGGPAPETVLLPPLGVSVRVSSDIVACDDPLTKRCLNWMHEHSESSIRQVDEICKAVSTSRRALERRFAATIGISPGEMLRRICLDAAGRRLLTSDAPVAEIGRRAGFTSATAFDRAFRQVTGSTPLAWRKQQSGR